MPEVDFVTVERANLRAAVDPVVLEWTARESQPASPTPGMDAGLPMPGVILVPDRTAIGAALDDLCLIVQAMTPEEIAARIVIRLPL